MQSTIAQEREFSFESKDETIERIISNLDARESFGGFRSLYYVYINDDVNKALEILERQLEFALEQGVSSAISNTYTDFGKAYTRKGDFRSAFENFQLAQEYADITGDREVNALISFYMGVAYQELELADIAIPFFEYAQDNFTSARNIWLATYELSRSYLRKGDLERVLEIIPILEITLPGSNKSSINTNFLYGAVVLSELHTSVGNIEKAKEMLTELFPYIQHYDRNYYLGIARLTMARIDSFENNYEAAVENATEAISHFEQLGDNAYILQSLLTLTLAYENLGNPEKAYEYLSARRMRIGQLRAQQVEAISQRIQSQNIQNAETESLLAQSERDEYVQRILIFSLAIVIVIGIWVGLLLLQESNRRKKTMSQLTSLNQDKNHFIGVVSHDLRSPLNSIMVLSEFLRDDAGEVDADTQREYGTIMFQATQQMQQLLNNMLDVNKIETNSTTLQLHPVNIKEVVENGIDTISILGRDKGIETELILSDELPQVSGDSNAIYRVLENLISNAYKFSPQHSTVTVKVSANDSIIALSVADRGPGLTDIDKSKLFRKFEKLSASPTGNEKSTGLGLYIVKNLVRQMNGTILVESNLGHGTTFKVLLNKA
ncbi:MAG: HAMP domain-containing histidine kinase [Balneolales bacterium]|nr:HAMP domain-containing histidine kinase [Balneolales bacterium]